MFFYFLVDPVIVAALHWKDHVARLPVCEGDILFVTRVSGSGEPDGGHSVHQVPRHVRNVLGLLQQWLQVVGGPHVHDEVPPVRFHPADDRVRL